MGAVGRANNTTKSSNVSATVSNSNKQASLDRAVRSGSNESVQRWLMNNMEIGDTIQIQEYDGNFYDYTVSEKAPAANRIEFTAYLPRNLAQETGGLVRTVQMRYTLLRRKYRLND